jgi:hypothetical protein
MVEVFSAIILTEAAIGYAKPGKTTIFIEELK